MQTTIIISARDAIDDTWWGITLPALRLLLQANNIKVEVVHLFLRDLKLTMNESAIPEDRTKLGFDSTEDCNEPDPFVSKYFYGLFIYMGTSCATPGSTHSEILGGKLKLQSLLFSS